MLKTSTIVVGWLSVAVMCAGCGQKGPLTLPMHAASAPAGAQPASSPAPAR